jgi:uncharacterized protein involved in type VI secretion and phage assembly
MVGNFRALVLDNNDPDKLGRIKVKVYGYFDGIQTEKLPWAVPAMPLFNGAGSGSGCFCIPAIGTDVWVFFERGDVYSPVYFAEATNGVKGLPANAVGDTYPNVRTIRTAGGCIISLDDTTDAESITLSVGNNEGQDIVGIVISRDNNSVVLTNSNFNLTIGSDGSTTLTGKTVKLSNTDGSGSITINNDGSIDIVTP